MQTDKMAVEPRKVFCEHASSQKCLAASSWKWRCEKCKLARAMLLARQIRTPHICAVNHVLVGPLREFLSARDPFLSDQFEVGTHARYNSAAPSILQAPTMFARIPADYSNGGSIEIGHGPLNGKRTIPYT